MHVYFDAEPGPTQTGQSGGEPSNPYGSAGTSSAPLEPESSAQRIPILPIPAAVLRRHGARVLEPDRAELLPMPPDPTERARRVGTPGYAPLQPTIYRQGVLLVPSTVDKTPLLAADIEDVNNLLKKDGLRARPDGDGRPAAAKLDDRDESIPRTTRLVLEAIEDARAVDAWTALQILRAASTRPTFQNSRAVEVIQGMSLEHLFLAAGIERYQDPTGAWHGSPAGGGDPVSSYLTPGGSARRPVAVVMPLPERRDLARRPVVLVLDTGIAENPWLGIPQAAPPSPGARVRVDGELQSIVRIWTTPTAQGDRTLQPIDDYWDRPVTDEPLVGQIDSATGHTVFIAGLIAQIAPDADVMSVRVMHSDGIVYEQPVLAVLDRLIERLTRVRDGRREASEMVDILCLSFGYYDETSDTRSATPLLRKRLDALVKLGVLVVASAGNDSTATPFYPAALSTELGPRFRSVGALNPNGTATLFSNDGRCVNTWATGAVVVSTFPVVQGSGQPANSVAPRPGANGRRPDRREALDEDDFISGWGVWSGASFAAPIAAAVLAKYLIENSDNDCELALDKMGTDATIRRATKAVDMAVEHTALAP